MKICFSGTSTTKCHQDHDPLSTGPGSGRNIFTSTSTIEEDEPGKKVNSGFPSYKSSPFQKSYYKKINGLKGLAPALPLTFANEGSYGLYEDLKDVIKQNFKNLLLTEPGERIMDVDFGVGLKSFLFEGLGEFTDNLIAQRIEEQKEKYMSYVNIEDVEFIVDEEDPNYYEIAIYYSIPDLSIEDSISVSIGE
mgnify:CR=1 FL=1